MKKKDNQKKLIEKLMKYVNSCIVKSKVVDKIEFGGIVGQMDNQHRDGLTKLLESTPNMALLNKKIFSYNYDLEQSEKRKKSMKKFKNQESNEQLNKDFEQFKNYVYSLLSTNNYQSKMSKTKVKVRLLSIANLFGKDDSENFKDLVQEGNLYLWEGLKKYGVLPDKAKNFNGRFEEGYKRHKSSKSTFVLHNLKNSYLNLGYKASSDKFKHIPIELKGEGIIEGEE